MTPGPNHKHHVPDDKNLLQQFCQFYKLYTEAHDLIKRSKFAVPQDEATAKAH